MLQVAADPLQRLVHAIYHEAEVVDARPLVRFAAVGPMGANHVGIALANLEERQVEKPVHYHARAARRLVAFLEAEALLVELHDLRRFLDHERHVADLRHSWSSPDPWHGRGHAPESLHLSIAAVYAGLLATAIFPAMK